MKIALLFTLILSSYAVSRSQSERDAGINFYRGGNYEKAIETLSPLVERSDADYPTALYLGAAYLRTASLDKATELFRNLSKYKAPTVPLRYEKA
jgi:Flp pilus assembly protein TadD